MKMWLCYHKSIKHLGNAENKRSRENNSSEDNKPSHLCLFKSKQCRSFTLIFATCQPNSVKVPKARLLRNEVLTAFVLDRNNEQRDLKVILMINLEKREYNPGVTVLRACASFMFDEVEPHCEQERAIMSFVPSLYVWKTHRELFAR